MIELCCMTGNRKVMRAPKILVYTNMGDYNGYGMAFKVWRKNI